MPPFLGVHKIGAETCVRFGPLIRVMPPLPKGEGDLAEEGGPVPIGNGEKGEKVRLWYL